VIERKSANLCFFFFFFFFRQTFRSKYKKQLKVQAINPSLPKHMETQKENVTAHIIYKTVFVLKKIKKKCRKVFCKVASLGAIMWSSLE